MSTKPLIIDLPKQGDSIIIRTTKFHTVIKHNSIGISIDVYTNLNKEPIKEAQILFDDYEE